MSQTNLHAELQTKVPVQNSTGIVSNVIYFKMSICLSECLYDSKYLGMNEPVRSGFKNNLHVPACQMSHDNQIIIAIIKANFNIA